MKGPVKREEREGGMSSEGSRSSARGLVLVSLTLVSCSVFSPAFRLEPVRLEVEERSNGFLVGFLTEASVVPKATTIIAPPNWLIVTIPDTLLDTTSVASFRSPLVDSTEVHRFETVTQYSLRFRKKITSSEILNTGASRSLVISVFF